MSATRKSCIDIDECLSDSCGIGAICENTHGSFHCQCPKGTKGDPTKKCHPVDNNVSTCSHDGDCNSGPQEVCLGQRCVCRRGFVRDELSGACVDLDECLESDSPVCGVNAVCYNLPGSYECKCPDGFDGNPFIGCQACQNSDCGCVLPFQYRDGKCHLASCSSNRDCKTPAKCVKITGGVSYCACPSGYSSNPDGSCQDINECEDVTICGQNAICQNTPGSHRCLCPKGMTGNAYGGVCSALQSTCTANHHCQDNEQCQNGICVCSPPFFVDNLDGNRCKSPCSQFNCGLNAECTPSNPPRCLCQQGYRGNPLTGCEDMDECLDSNSCKSGAQCVNIPGSFQCHCPPGCRGDPYVTGCSCSQRPRSEDGSFSECKNDDDCPGQLACSATRQCNNPCSSVPCGTHAVCVPENHAAWCRCLPGFYENDDGECVSQCKEITCGRNAKCIVSPQGPACACNEGTFGNPYPGGVCITTTCSASKPCSQTNEICHNGNCIAKACGPSKKPCGQNAICDPVLNTCVCADGFIGDATLLCMPPTHPAQCAPVCGFNAHCEYGSPNNCRCNDGFTGNPYSGCQPLSQGQKTCNDISCSANAVCSLPSGQVSCTCERGFTGNGFNRCVDIDECQSSSTCGINAECINTEGGFDCRCHFGFVGNPFTGCTATEASIEDDLCADQKCGPNAVCSHGQCLCMRGFKGDDPYDLITGCSASSTCQRSTDCGYNEICKQLPNSLKKFCADPCATAVCGPNSFCVTDNHNMNCICNEGFSGDANDLQNGCKPDVSCKKTSECPAGFVCQVDINGRRSCLDPCQIMSCLTESEECAIRQDGVPICQCKQGFAKDKLTGTCRSATACKGNH